MWILCFYPSKLKMKKISFQIGILNVKRYKKIMIIKTEIIMILINENDEFRIYKD